MKLRRLLTTLFICSCVSCGTPQSNIKSRYFYEYRTTPNHADFIVFNETKTQFIYNGDYEYTCRFEDKKIYGSTMGLQEICIGFYNSLLDTIVINTSEHKFIVGEYVVNTTFKYRGDFKQ